MQAAVEARTGRVMTMDDVEGLFAEVARIRFVTRQTRLQLEIQRFFRETLSDTRADKAALERARKIISEDEGLSSDERLAAITPIDCILMGRINNAIHFAEGKIADEAISLACGLKETAKRSPRSKHTLNVLVLQGTICWCHVTGDELERLRIGHPNHPGPFLQFLGALADGVPGGITMHSLHDKARQIAGRRG
jgi:hypothetical protein